MKQKEPKLYDYLIVDTGLYGATFAYQAKQQGKKCLVIDKRSHLGGNVYCENVEGWNFVNPILAK
jgi:UDP-galactopyranose mutase